MKTHVGWLVASLIVSALLAVALVYELSSAPDYGEAEPLFPVAAELGRELTARAKERKIEWADLEALLAEERFSSIRPYGFVLSRKEDELVVIRINKTFSFRIGKDGYPTWEKKRPNQTVEPTR